MTIPWRNISPDTLDSLTESFILHKGTDYSEHKHSFERKVAGVKRQLQLGEAVLVWSGLRGTVSIMSRKRIHG